MRSKCRNKRTKKEYFIDAIVPAFWGSAEVYMVDGNGRFRTIDEETFIKYYERIINV